MKGSEVARKRECRCFYLDGLDAIENPLRHVDASNVLLETGIGLDGHNTRNNRTTDAVGTTGLDPVQEHGHIKEELRDNEVCTCIDLFLEVLEILLHRG